MYVDSCDRDIIARKLKLKPHEIENILKSGFAFEMDVDRHSMHPSQIGRPDVMDIVVPQPSRSITDVSSVVVTDQVMTMIKRQRSDNKYGNIILCRSTSCPKIWVVENCALIEYDVYNNPLTNEPQDALVVQTGKTKIQEMTLNSVDNNPMGIYTSLAKGIEGLEWHKKEAIKNFELSIAVMEESYHAPK